MMRHIRYAKYVVTLLASTALTFHFLQSRLASFKASKEPAAQPHRSRLLASKHVLLRRAPQDADGAPVTPRWIVLPGNVTVHAGRADFRYDADYVINAQHICGTFNASRNRHKLLVFVASSADHFAQRKAIRGTWGLKFLQDAYDFRVVFVLGRSDHSATEDLILKESVRYGDLVQVNLSESFRNLGLKSAAGLEWARAFCSEADFIMKTDDDILVHVPNLLAALKAARDPETLLMCHENRMRKILRKELADQIPAGYRKYEVSENELPGAYYPPYCSGMAYVFSRGVGDRLLLASRSTPVFFIEDVYLTGFCRHKAGVLITPNAGITLRPPINMYQVACAFRDGRITSQEVGAGELRKLWAELNTQGFFCPRLLGYARQKTKEFEKSSMLLELLGG